MNLLTTFAGSMMEGFLPARLGPRQDRRLLLASARRRSASASRGGIRDFEPVPCDSVADFDVMMGHEIATAIKQDPRPRPAGRADPAGRPDGHVPLGGLLPQGMGCLVRSCLRIQHGRVERPRRRDAAAGQPGRLPERDAGGVLRAAGLAHRSRVPALVRHGRSTAALRRADRRAQEPRGPS